jgi:hypothetical protein
MYIQYVGFNGTAASRVYGFHVIDAPHQPREFSVEIQSEVFGSSKLRLQDGPHICFARLKQGLLEETQGARAQGHLNISDQDVRMYLETHRPATAPGKRKRRKVG